MKIRILHILVCVTVALTPHAEVTEAMRTATKEAWAMIKDKDYEGAYRTVKPMIGTNELIESGAALSLARVYENGCASVAKDRARAAQLYLALIDECPNASVVNAARQYLNRMQSADDETAVAALDGRGAKTLTELRALAMEHERLSNLADHEADQDKAIALYQQAIERYGDAESMHRLSMIYYRIGIDGVLAMVPNEGFERAASLMMRGADETDFPWLKRNASLVCLYGIGTKQDLTKAQHYNDEFVAACKRLGNVEGLDKAEFVQPKVTLNPSIARWSAVVDGSQFKALKQKAVEATKQYNEGLRSQKAEQYAEAMAKFQAAELACHPLAESALRPYKQ